MWQRITLGLVALMTLSGCFSALTPGASPARRPPATAQRVWTVPQCQNLLNGAPVAGPQGTYQLAQEAGLLVLYELDNAGRGVRITNHWTDGQGDNFFTFIRNSHGYHYIIPPNRSQPATRFVYLAGTYSVGRVGDDVRPTGGQPSARCPMIPR